MYRQNSIEFKTKMRLWMVTADNITTEWIL